MVARGLRRRMRLQRSRVTDTAQSCHNQLGGGGSTFGRRAPSRAATGKQRQHARGRSWIPVMWGELENDETLQTGEMQAAVGVSGSRNTEAGGESG